ncbi:MAG: hypothetical protein HY735_04450 [Verrucomicrobia bacterium]|nr:hypothetical protein [Verrucomicrobiota bacterium]
MKYTPLTGWVNANLAGITFPFVSFVCFVGLNYRIQGPASLPLRCIPMLSAIVAQPSSAASSSGVSPPGRSANSQARRPRYRQPVDALLRLRGPSL